ncbi:spike base protein, RCAP_Rcc01079 family [Sphingobium xenophagum]|uniref:spike base protein, RCAP_Rcc01079 family n=1 Tax=Sphingobium xenophagum TaxID=121428 RepID=UPI00037C3BAC|nr:hypothetical protein [Sphingobium xenophagum]
MPPFNSAYSTGVSYTALPDITPDADNDLPVPVRLIDVIGGGDVTFRDGRGSLVAMTGLPAGYIIKCVVTRVVSSTATKLIGYP